MDEEIEDLVGDVKCTESQKSVAASNVYSMNFTDSSSEKNNSSGKETYVIEWDDSEDSEKAYELHENQSIINLNDKTTAPLLMYINNGINNKTSKSTSSCFHKCSYGQEIFTQTSKTIFELAETERGIKNTLENKTLETQTSFMSITENQIIEYRIQVSGAETTFRSHNENNESNETNNCHLNTFNQLLSPSLDLDDGSSKFLVSETETQAIDDCENETGSILFNMISEEESKEKDDLHLENNTSLDISSKSDTDIDEDSLMCNEYTENKNDNADHTSDTSEVPKSVDSEVEDIYNKFSERINHGNVEKGVQDTQRFNALTPLTEESTVKKESLFDITPSCNNIIDSKYEEKYDVLFVNNSGAIIKIFSDKDSKDIREDERENLKLPVIKSNFSCPCSPHLNLRLGNVQKSNVNKNLLSDGGRRQRIIGDRWEIGTTDLAAGESAGKSDPMKKLNEQFQLPPIHGEANLRSNSNSKTVLHQMQNSKNKYKIYAAVNKPIDIKDKITELKINNNSKYWQQPLIISTTESKTSRTVSPDSRSPEDSRLGDVAERGCEALCLELLKRLKSPSWFEVSDTLEELPRVMEKFWLNISENRIADLIRQVSSHVESPRSQVAKLACSTLAAILKNTNYTKKPDFYEAVTILLVKTGSFSRPVRRAANVALDAVVCCVELAHTVTALCVHGASHKSPLVRCAAARLMVVSCALAGGGRALLRTRPPSAACARRHALRALAALLEDKNTDTRKYAERLYSMLRPLSNFEAFYLTDVEVEVASRQMKKFDKLLLNGPQTQDEAR